MPVVTDRDIGAALAVVIEAQARLEAEPVGDVPGELAEAGEAGVREGDVVGRGQPVQHRRIAGIGVGRNAGARAERDVAGIEQPAARRRALDLQALGVQILVEGEGAGDELDMADRRRIADFLRPLVLLRGIGGDGRDRQAGEVAVARRSPVPEAPGGDRGQGAGADLPFGAQRDAAELLAGPQLGVEVGQPVERVGARRRVAEGGGERRELAVERPLRRAGAHVDLGAAQGVLEAVIRRTR